MAASQNSRAKNVREDITTRLEEQSFLFRGAFVGGKKKRNFGANWPYFLLFFFHLGIAQCGEISLRAFRREHKCEVILGDAMTKEV